MLKKFLLPFILLFGTANFVFAQSNFSNEIGIISGPVSFQSDYGERGDLGAYMGNTGFGIGLVHYVDLSWKGYNNYKAETYFDKHFKLRNELSFSKSKFQHNGLLVKKASTSLGANQLKGMRGETAITNIGFQLEYYIFNIHDFQNATGSLKPFISFGANYSLFIPKSYSLLGPLENNISAFPKFIGATSNKTSTTMSLAGSVGARYKLDILSDLIIEFKTQYYFSDWVDGLKPDPSIYKENKANDWLVWLNVGYIYYLSE